MSDPASASKARQRASRLIAGAVRACFLSQASAQTDIQCLEPNQFPV